MADKTKVTLSNPLPPADAERMGLDPEKFYGVNDTIEVSHDFARTLINAGYAQIDPEDTEAVRAALGEDAVPSTATEPSATSGNKSTKKD